jgi:hypothetical protein
MDEIETTKERPPNSTWMKLTPAQRKSADARIAQLKKGVEPVTNLRLYHDLKSMASTPGTRNKFLKTDLMKHKHELERKDFDELFNLQISLRNKDPEVTGKLNGLQSQKQIVDNALRLMNINISNKADEDDIVKSDSFRRQVDNAIVDWKRETGKAEIPTSEVRRIVDDLTFVVAEDERTFRADRPIRFFEFREEGGTINVGAVQEVDDVPDIEQEKIKSALRRKGRPITDEAIMSAFRRKLLRIRNAF